MDRPFDPNSWTPTNPWEWEPWKKPYPIMVVRALIKQLNQNTTAIKLHPYDPRLWIRRSKTLVRLRYPELAVGDAHKAVLLAQTLLDALHEKPNSRVGRHMGFWMRDPDADDTLLEEEHEHQQKVLETIHEKAEHLIRANLCFSPSVYRGKFVPAPYPWVLEKHNFRSDSLIEDVNVEFADPANGASGGVTCLVRRYAFGFGVGAREGADLLGVFAARDIEPDGMILTDHSCTWGSVEPDAIVSETSADECSKDEFLWIRDRLGRDASNMILKCRLLIRCVRDNVQHPLDHPLIARMTPTYHSPQTTKIFSTQLQEEQEETFSLQDLIILTQTLQTYKIDVFANHNYDTWTLFVLRARLDNNQWSDPNTTCLSSLFALFNPSCDPNVVWKPRDDRRGLELSTNRLVRAGEQLFVEYDGFVHDASLAERRMRLFRWLDGGCRCGRCVREEAEQVGRGLGPLTNSFSSGEWDTDEKPVFPEDGGEWGDGLVKA